MKVIITESQQTYIQKVMKAIERESKGTPDWPNKHHILQFYGLQDTEIDYLLQIERDALDKFKGLQFDVSDYASKVSIGGYDFTFSIYGLEGEEYISHQALKDTSWTVHAYVKLEGATVELVVSTGEALTLEDALSRDFGWEIESEINDIISDIIVYESPILKALGAYISVETDFSYS
tara:strand:+ start:996 stop:1529 length:534 start_codon:yes stop_codon:yes gene_type:complete